MTQKAGQRITLDDVRQAVEKLGGDPFHTNAARIREVIGSGGYSTIQKHLETLRNEQIPSSEDDKVPEPPKAPAALDALVRGVWVAAWAEASRQYADRLARARERITDLESKTMMLSIETAAMAEQIEALENERDEALARAAEAEAERQSIAGERAALEALMKRLKAMMPAA